jgi:DNA-binding MarR family transcriptional regulator
MAVIMAEDKSTAAAGQALHDLFREIFALHAALTSIIDEVHKQSGLNPAQHRILGVLSRTAPATVPDIAIRLGVSRQFVQKVCNDLSSSGLIGFTDNPRHKRSKWVELTKPGRTAYEKARREENRIIAEALPEIEKEESIQARRLLEKIRKSLPSAKAMGSETNQ